MPAIGQAKVSRAQSVTGSNSYYTDATELPRMQNVSYHHEWTGTPSGAFSFWISNKPDPGIADDTDWVELTLATPPTDPAGSAGKTAVDLNQIPYRWIRAKYVNASGSGTWSSWFMGKGI